MVRFIPNETSTALSQTSQQEEMCQNFRIWQIRRTYDNVMDDDKLCLADEQTLRESLNKFTEWDDESFLRSSKIHCSFFFFCLVHETRQHRSNNKTRDFISRYAGSLMRAYLLCFHSFYSSIDSFASTTHEEFCVLLIRTANIVSPSIDMNVCTIQSSLLLYDKKSSLLSKLRIELKECARIVRHKFMFKVLQMHRITTDWEPNQVDVLLYELDCRPTVCISLGITNKIPKKKGRVHA